VVLARSENAVLHRLIGTDIGEIRVFSRDEKKQDDMRRAYQNSKLTFYIGDVRDERSLRDAMDGVDFVFQAAALKQVPSCEFFPLQALRTNTLGTENVLSAAIEAGVKRVIVLSTDQGGLPNKRNGNVKGANGKGGNREGPGGGCENCNRNHPLRQRDGEQGIRHTSVYSPTAERGSCDCDRSGYDPLYDDDRRRG
jgi:hypothetical protein